MNYIQYMQSGGNFVDKLKTGIKKFLKAAGEASRMAKDARVNNPGAAMIRDAYAKGDKELAKLLTDEMQAANLTGIMIGSGAGPLATGFATAPVTTGVTLATGAAGSMGGMIATDKAIEHFSDGLYTGWGDWVNLATNGTIGENTANVFHPGAIVGGIAGGSVGNKAMSYVGPVADDYVVSNVKYLKDTKFKGVPEGGNMEAYVPKTVKQNVETGVNGTMQLLENLGVTDLPQITTTYENMPLTGSHMGHTGDLHVGFDSKTLHNPFKYWKVYNEKPGLGINYSFMAGHEPAHLVHPSRAHYMKASGEPMLYDGNPVVKGFGTVRGLFDISLLKYYLDPKTNKFYEKPGTYYTAPDELLEAGLFTDINKPRQNIMKGLPNTTHSQAHLRAPMEMDADLYALYNMGHIKNGQVSDEGILFLMLRHNLSKEGVLNTIDDLQVIGYDNALSREPINANWIPGNQYTRSTFAELTPRTQPQGVLSSTGTRSAKISEAERLGIPKGDRGNLSASQQEAVRDLHHYITDGKFRLKFLFDAETNLFFWGNAKPTPSTNAITTIARHPQATIRLGDDGIGYMRIPTEYGTLTYFPHLKTTSHTISFPKSEINPQGFGEAAARAENLFGKSIILTSPKTDAIDAGVVVEGLSSTVPKRQVHDFYKQLALTSKSGTYVTGDAAAYPLGLKAIMDYAGGNSTKAIATILSGETPTVTAASRTGLSPDSYISLLRSAQRPEWKLSFNRKLGFGKWNNSAVNNSDIYDAWKAAMNGSLEDKQAYIKLFNDWVAPYGGAPAYLDGKGVIIHPHPFIVRQKQGGKLNYLNYFN